MADVNRGNRPLSPHLTVYRPQISSMTSILTRISGTSLILAALLVVWWFLAAAVSAQQFALADGFMTSWLGDLIMTLSAWALWYHALAGLRHLYWDTGRGLEVATAERTGIAIVVLSIALTVATVLVV